MWRAVLVARDLLEGLGRLVGPVGVEVVILLLIEQQEALSLVATK